MILVNKALAAEEIESLSSKYFTEGRKDESWEILNIDVTGKILKATLRMKSIYISPTDELGFHLSQSLANEFISQITIIFALILGGYKEKTRECWMIESSISCKKAIRNPDKIEITTEIISFKKTNGKILIATKSRIEDEHGFFEGKIKGLIA